MSFLPNDYCRCTGERDGEVCERRDTCLRYIYWRDKKYHGNSPFVSVSPSLCHWEDDKEYWSNYIEDKS